MIEWQGEAPSSIVEKQQDEHNGVPMCSIRSIAFGFFAPAHATDFAPT
jgi:hypothetical protein